MTSTYTRTPIPKHMHKYTKAKVPHTQGKHTQLGSFTELYCDLIKSLADASLPECWHALTAHWLLASLKTWHKENVWLFFVSRKDRAFAEDSVV